MRINHVAIIGSVACLIILFFLVKSLDIEKIEIKKAKAKNVGEWVKIEGKIKWIKNYGGLIIFEVCDGECIIVVGENLRCEKRSKVEVTGTVFFYKGEKEIKAREVKC